jgi:hypothetical protein
MVLRRAGATDDAALAGDVPPLEIVFERMVLERAVL